MGKTSNCYVPIGTPYHEQLKNYEEVRRRIFSTANNKMAKTQECDILRKQQRKKAAATLIEGMDSRIYTKIRINEE